MIGHHHTGWNVLFVLTDGPLVFAVKKCWPYRERTLKPLLELGLIEITISELHKTMRITELGREWASREKTYSSAPDTRKRRETGQRQAATRAPARSRRGP